MCWTQRARRRAPSAASAAGAYCSTASMLRCALSRMPGLHTVAGGRCPLLPAQAGARAHAHGKAERMASAAAVVANAYCSTVSPAPMVRRALRRTPGLRMAAGRRCPPPMTHAGARALAHGEVERTASTLPSAASVAAVVTSTYCSTASMTRCVLRRTPGLHTAAGRWCPLPSVQAGARAGRSVGGHC
jgi:hypothetical protein